MRVFLTALAALALGGCRRAKVPTGASVHARQVLEEFSMSEDRLGKKEWSLQARFALLNEQNQEISLSAPRMEFFEKAKPTSMVESLQGTAELSSHDILLSSHVVMTSTVEQSVLRTEELHYSDSRKKFYTDADVELTQPSGVLHGKGLEADPNLSEVRIFKQNAVVGKSKI